MESNTILGKAIYHICQKVFKKIWPKFIFNQHCRDIPDNNKSFEMMSKFNHCASLDSFGMVKSAIFKDDFQILEHLRYFQNQTMAIMQPSVSKLSFCTLLSFKRFHLSFQLLKAMKCKKYVNLSLSDAHLGCILQIPLILVVQFKYFVTLK